MAGIEGDILWDGGHSRRAEMKTAWKSALCKAFHKADYAKSLIMESSWVDWR